MSFTDSFLWHIDIITVVGCNLYAIQAFPFEKMYQFINSFMQKLPLSISVWKLETNISMSIFQALFLNKVNFKR